MLLKLTLVSALLFSCAFVAANEKPECGSAVDAADRLSPDSDKDCDYTKTGLNGVLHRALSKSSDSATTKNQVTEEINSSAVAVDKPKQNTTNEFNSAQQLQSVKLLLLEKVVTECPKGFVVEGEKYVPTSSKVMKLELIYHCL